MSYYLKDHHDGGDEVDDFYAYDPTAYSGGYDIAIAYGRPLPPSEEICYPKTSSSNSDDFDYDRPQYSSSAYGDEALENEYKSYVRRPPHSRPPSSEEGFGGGRYGYGRKSENEEPSLEYGSGYGRKIEYEYRTGYGRKSEYEEPTPERGSGYGRKRESEYSEYGAGYERRPEPEESEYGSGYGRKREPEYSEYGAGYGRRPETKESEYGSGYGRKREPEYSEYGAGYGRRPEPKESEYGSGYGRKLDYGEEQGGGYGYGYGYGYGGRTEAEAPSFGEERLSYGRFEEEDYQRPSYWKRDDDEKEGYGRRRKYFDNEDDDYQRPSYGKRDEEEEEGGYGRKKYFDDEEEDYQRPSYGKRDDDDDNDKGYDPKKYGGKNSTKDLEGYQSSPKGRHPVTAVNQRTQSNMDECCRCFSLAEIKLATNNFDDACVVGKGGFGNVYKGSIDDGAKIVAIKRLKLESKQGAFEFQTEINMLSTCRHVHVVSLIGYCDEDQEMLLVYEYMAHGTLADHLIYKDHNKFDNGNGNSPLSWERRLRICIGAARGLDYLHTYRGVRDGLIHRDIKSSNILLDENLVVKISDFGLSKMINTSLSSTHISTEGKGTIGYLDPEYYMTRRLTKKSDIYGFGVVLFEVLCGRPAVDTSLEEEQHNLAQWAQHCIQEGNLDQIVDPSVSEQISLQCLNAFAEIAIKCLHKSRKERPTMAEVVTSLVFALKRQGSAYFDTEEENINVGMIKKDHSSNLGPTRGLLHSLWRKVQPFKIKTPPPEKLCRYFSLMEIKEATNNFTHLPLNRIDTDSEVYIGIINDMMTVIVQLLTSIARHKEFLIEVLVLSKLRHPNLVPIVGYCYDKNTMILIYDYKAQWTLYDYLQYTATKKLFSWKQRLETYIYAARGLNYLHTGTDQTIIHGHVNLHNIFLENGLVAKVLKLGGHISGNTTDFSSITIGTHQYVDPEYWETSSLTVKSDVYSLGLVLLKVLCGGKVVDVVLEEERRCLDMWAKDRITAGVVDHIIDPYMVGKISSDSFHVFLDIANECLLVRGSERPTMLRVVRRLELALEVQENADAIGGNYQPGLLS